MSSRHTLPYPARSAIFQERALLHGLPVGLLISQSAHASVFYLGKDRVLLVYHNGCEPAEELRSALRKGPARLCPVLEQGFAGGHSYDVLPRLRVAPFWNTLNLESRRQAVAEELQAIQALHKLGYCHLDLKPEHFMLDDTGGRVLIDFGAARPVRGNRTGFTPRYTPYYAAPELKGGGYSTASDMYSYGVMLRERENSVCRTGFSARHFSELVGQLLHTTPETRLSAAQALELLRRPCPRIVLGPLSAEDERRQEMVARRERFSTARTAFLGELVAIAERANPVLAARQFKEIPSDWERLEKLEAICRMFGLVERSTAPVNLTNITRQNVRAVIGCSVITQIPASIRCCNAAAPEQILPPGSYYILSRDEYSRWRLEQRRLAEQRRRRNWQIAKTVAIVLGFIALLPFAFALAIVGIIIALIFAILGGME